MTWHCNNVVDANAKGTVAEMVAVAPNEAVVILVWGVLGDTRYMVLGALVVANGVYSPPAFTPRYIGVVTYPSLVSICATCCVVLSVLVVSHDQVSVATVFPDNCKT